MIKTSLTRWFDLSTPIIGAPMAGVAGGALARAVSVGGGLGMIGFGPTATPEFIAEQCAIPADAEASFGVGQGRERLHRLYVTHRLRVTPEA